MELTSMEEFSHPCHVSVMAKLLTMLIPAEARPDRVGPRITALREALNLSKAQFADSISLNRSTQTKVEAGKEGLDIAKGIAISTLYGVGLDFIYRGDLSDLPLDLRSKVLAILAAASDQS